MNATPDISDTARIMAESIAALPPLPATAQEILTCFGDEFIDADKVTAVVEGDPGICAKLLGLSNSAFFGLPEPVTTMGEAISRVLGVDTVRSLVLAMAIQQSFNSRKCPAFSTDRFWTQSLLTAECCKKLVLKDSQATDTLRDLAYSAGLCHNLGLMALAHMEPKRTSEVLAEHKADPEASELGPRLRTEFGTDHRTVTAELGRFWSLPDPMAAAYDYRAGVNETGAERLAQVVAAAAAAVGNVENPQRVTDLEPLAGNFGMSADDLQSLAVLPARQQERVESLASNMTA